jgi:hypothetical protein
VARRDTGVIVVLALAIGLRIAVTLAYRPALLWDDSWEYLDLAWGQSFVAFEVDHPSGYPAIIWLLSRAGRSLVTIVAVQHLAGLLAGVGVYALLVRQRINRWVAALGSAVVLLDGYAIAVEEYVMSEAFFGLALIASAYAAIRGRDRPSVWALSGLCLAGAATFRTAALFAVPAWLGYMVWIRPGRRSAAAALAALLVPVLAYSVLHAHAGRGFGMTQGEGWFLYGRVGPIIDCRGVKVTRTEAPLCNVAYGHSLDPDTGQPRWSPSDYTDNPASPAAHMFVDMYTGDVDHSSRVLGDFAKKQIRHRPWPYVRSVADDFLAYFDPNGGGMETAITLPRRGQQDGFDPDTKARLLPRYRREFHAPYQLVRAYQRAIHTPRWLMGLFALSSVLALLLGAWRRARKTMAYRAQTLLLAGMAVGMLVGTAAVSSMFVRYLVPAVPLLVCAGVLSLSDLASLTSRGRLVARSARKP